MDIRVCPQSELTEGSFRTIQMEGKPVTVAHVNGQYFAFDDTCAHKGGPLGKGKLDQNIVTCPWHEWKWNIQTGACLTNDRLSIQTYSVISKEGIIFVSMK